jgi:hypothetical protein
MKTIRNLSIIAGGAITAAGIAVLSYRVFRRRQAGIAEKIGKTVDSSMSIAAKKLKEAAIALEEYGNNGGGKKLGKGLDVVIADAWETIGKASDVVQHAAKHSG